MTMSFRNNYKLILLLFMSVFFGNTNLQALVGKVLFLLGLECASFHMHPYGDLL